MTESIHDWQKEPLRPCPEDYVPTTAITESPGGWTLHWWLAQPDGTLVHVMKKVVVTTPEDN